MDDLNLGSPSQKFAHNTIAKGFEPPSTYEELHQDCLACILVGASYSIDPILGNKCTLPGKQDTLHPYMSKFLMLNNFINKVGEQCVNSPSCKANNYN